MKCSLCTEEFYVKFNDYEIKKGVKYIECPRCYWFLKINLNGIAEPVPLFLSFKPPYKTRQTISQTIGQFMSILNLN